MAITLMSKVSRQSHEDNCSSCHTPSMDDPFSLLVEEIRNYLGPSHGIDSTHVDVGYLKAIMAKYTSNPKEWEHHARADISRNYTRNMVDNVNGNANLVLIVWNPGKGSPIHDHADAHCVMKILQGSVRETVYHKPDSGTPPGAPLKVKRDTTHSANEVAYISDQIGLHRVWNPTTEFAVSLHLYTPPNAAEYGFHIYDEKTGKSSHVRQS